MGPPPNYSGKVTVYYCSENKCKFKTVHSTSINSHRECGNHVFNDGDVILFERLRLLEEMLSSLPHCCPHVIPSELLTTGTNLGFHDINLLCKTLAACPSRKDQGPVMAFLHQTASQLLGRSVGSPSKEWSFLIEMLAIVNPEFHQPSQFIRIENSLMSMYLLLSLAAPSTLAALRKRDMADQDSAYCIAQFVLVPPFKTMSLRSAILAFKPILDGPLSQVKNKYDLRNGTKLGTTLRTMLGEVNPDWDVPPLPMRPSLNSSEPTPSTPVSSSSSIQRQEPQLLSDLLNDEISMVECNQARPCAIAPLKQAPPAGPRWNLDLLYYHNPRGENEEENKNELIQARTSLALTGEWREFADSPMWPPPGTQQTSQKTRPSGKSNKVSAMIGPRDVLQPWPVPVLKNRVDPTFWAATDVCTLPIAPCVAARLLGLHNTSSTDPAYETPPLGQSWLHSIARPNLPPLLKVPKRRSDKKHRGGGIKEEPLTETACFRGYNEKEFTDPRAEAEEYIDPSLLAYAHAAGICNDTQIRWAVPSDAQALVAVNKVNARYKHEDYVASMAAKNDFILVAERNGHVVGFIEYYLQYFTGSLVNSRQRATPKPIVYVSTVQTATEKSHPEYASSLSSSSSSQTTMPFQGAAPRTGVLLMALAIAHGYHDKRESLFIDSTLKAVPFYRRFFHMESSVPALDHSYVPMYLDLSSSSGFSRAHLLRPLATPSVETDVSNMRLLGRLNQSPWSLVPPMTTNSPILPFAKAREFMHQQGINEKDWKAWCESGRPANIPSHPNKHYKGRGWKSWCDFLGQYSKTGCGYLSTTEQNGTERRLKRSRDQLSVKPQQGFSFQINIPEGAAKDELLVQVTRSYQQNLLSSSSSSCVVENLTCLKPIKSPAISWVKSFEPLLGLPDESGGQDQIQERLRLLQSSLQDVEARNRGTASLVYQRVQEEASLLLPNEREKENAAIAATLKQYDALISVDQKKKDLLQQRVEEDMNAHCAICLSGEVDRNQQIVFCEYCNVAVHQQCYGIPMIPDDDWFCAACVAAVPEAERLAMATSSTTHSQIKSCALCPAKVGALLPTDDPRLWVHSICADLASMIEAPPNAPATDPIIVSAKLVRAATVEPHIQGQILSRTTTSMSCCLCGDGAVSNVASCSDCDVVLHVSCATANDCDAKCTLSNITPMENLNSSSSSDSLAMRRVWTVKCPRHSKKRAVESTEGSNKKLKSTSMSARSKSKLLDTTQGRKCHLCHTRNIDSLVCSSCNAVYCFADVKRLGGDVVELSKNSWLKCYRCTGECGCAGCISKGYYGVGMKKRGQRGRPPKQKRQSSVERSNPTVISAPPPPTAHIPLPLAPPSPPMFEPPPEPPITLPLTHFGGNVEDALRHPYGARCGACGLFDIADTQSAEPSMRSCVKCGVFVHTACIITEREFKFTKGITSSTADWMCDACSEPSSTYDHPAVLNPAQGSNATFSKRQCQLCPVPGGFIVQGAIEDSSPSRIRRFFAHGACLRELRKQRKNIENMVPCCGCGLSSGVRVQCEYRHRRRVSANGYGSVFDEYIQCSRMFHVICGHQANLDPYYCHDHSNPKGLQSRLLALLEISNESSQSSLSSFSSSSLSSSPYQPANQVRLNRDSKLLHRAVSVLTELTWAHLPIGGVSIDPKLLSVLILFRRNLVDPLEFEGLLNEVFQQKNSGFPQITPNEGRVIASILGEVLRRAPESVPRGSAAANLVVCVHCSQPRTGVPFLEHCRCGNFFHAVCAGWGLRNDRTLTRNGVSCNMAESKGILDCGCQRVPPNTISSSRSPAYSPW